VHEAIAGGSRFFTTIRDRGILLYDATGVPLPSSHLIPPNKAVKDSIQEYWQKEYTLAPQFLDAASSAISKGLTTLAVFLLHQAMERTVSMMVRMYTGYRTNTHNLTRLIALTENFSWLPVTVFPCLTKEETDLFNLLQRGYSDTRYKEGYSISAEKVRALVERVKEMQAIAEVLYQEKLKSLDYEGISFPIMGEGIKN
jgi:HEPN domain-containing protein